MPGEQVRRRRKERLEAWMRARRFFGLGGDLGGAPVAACLVVLGAALLAVRAQALDVVGAVVFLAGAALGIQCWVRAMAARRRSRL